MITQKNKLVPYLPYNKGIFKTTHSSYSGGARKSIEFQLNSKIRCLEFDVHNEDNPLLHNFKLGHNKPEEDLSYEDNNPTTVLLADWLKHIYIWSKKNPKHEPISLCIDIKENLVDSPSALSLKFLNSIIHNQFKEHLFTPRAQIKRNKGSLSGVNWPTVDELSGKIIVFLTGEHNTKRIYWNDIPLRDQFCFVAYSYEDDGGKEYSEQMLNDVKFVNCHLAYWAWGNHQFLKGKILRIWGFNPSYDNLGKFTLPTELNQQGLLCNFPATDNPFEHWYSSAFSYYC